MKLNSQGHQSKFIKSKETFFESTQVFETSY